MSNPESDRVDSQSAESEDRYWELEKNREDRVAKSNRVEQARRNVEALQKLLGYVADDDRLGNKALIVDAINKNIKVMEEVTKL